MQDKTAVDFTEYISFYLEPYNLQGTCYTQNHTHIQRLSGISIIRRLN